MRSVDFNCDLGEGGENDAALMRLITSANIACGGHAGDIGTMQRTVKLAEEFDVSIGAHPGFEDRKNFGRVERSVKKGEVYQLVTEQVERLRGMATVRHVKPHGALYNMGARDRSVATEIAQAVRDIDGALVLVGLAGSELVAAGLGVGLRVANEVFADRRYNSGGRLVPRRAEGAVINDPNEALGQVLDILKRGRVRTSDGGWQTISADSICVHGDGSQAVSIVEALRSALVDENIRMEPF